MIEISHLHKRFGKFAALQDISLSIPRTKVTGIIGPNGSGKSTLIKIILGLVHPTSGTLSVNGFILNGDAEYRRWIGYMPQLARFPQDLEGWEILKMIKRLRGEQPSLEKELIELFELKPELDKRIRALSGGNRQKLSVVISCMYDPDLLIFDEPTAGLDPVSSTRLKDFIQSLKQKSKTVIMASHIMSDIEELADDVVLLLDGRIRFSGSIRDLKLRTGQPALERAIVEILEEDAA
jgi:Cu-processing system ATP-binding protein